jgi:heme/copper-type cytochrome/quinol oxidase subunit 2
VKEAGMRGDDHCIYSRTDDQRQAGSVETRDPDGCFLTAFLIAIGVFIVIVGLLLYVTFKLA